MSPPTVSGRSTPSPVTPGGRARLGRTEDKIADAPVRVAQLPFAGQLLPPRPTHVAPGLGEPVERHALHVLARLRRAAVLVEVDAAVTLLRRPDRTEHLECVIGVLRHSGRPFSGITSICTCIVRVDRTARASATMEMATSPGVLAPRSSPAGPWMRVRSVMPR